MASNPPQTRLQSYLRLTSGLLVSALLVWLAVRGIAWGQVWALLRQTRPILLALAVLASLLTSVLRAERWRALFGRGRHLRLIKFVEMLLLGQSINALVPLRLGELLRAYLIAGLEPVGKAEALWTTVYEKALDVLALLLCLAALWTLIPAVAWLPTAAWTLSALFALALVALVAAFLLRAPVGRCIAASEQRWPWLARLRLGRLFAALLASSQPLGDGRQALALVARSLAIFLVGAGVNWLTALALGLPLGLRPALFVLAVLQLSAVVPIPSAPGRLGVFHYLCVLALAVFGVGRETALGYALLLHVVTYLPIALGGPLAMAMENLTWRGLLRLLYQQPTSPPHETR